MNLFILDTDPIQAAKQNCDVHVCKIILEAAQMMCLAHWANGDWAPYYAKSQMNNKVSRWVRERLSNYKWTLEHAIALCDEYTYRYNKTHKTGEIIKWCGDNIPNLPSGDRTDFIQAVSDDCLHESVVMAYRLYYVRHKSKLAKWRMNNTPQWYSEMS